MPICVATTANVALLGCGNVGAAFARLAAERGDSLTWRVSGALVRDPTRARSIPPPLPLSTDPRAVLNTGPQVVVELLGGVEPARTLLLEAFSRRIAVVTGNKSLLARHGAELREAAAETRTPLLYEAAVLAGVPFLGTFARRPEAAKASGLLGILNGTTNFVLTRCAGTACAIDEAVDDAQRLGYAEPDPRSDLSGTDAAEKLAVLLQHFASAAVHPEAIHTTGINTITPGQLADASELGGTLKPVVSADWRNGLQAFVGPAFVPAAHVLSRVDGVDNVILLDGRHGRLLFQGPGAGPDVTAAAVLDDVGEAAAGRGWTAEPPLTATRPQEPETGWMITLESARLPRAVEVADLLACYGLFAYRTTSRVSRDGCQRESLLVWPAERDRVDEAIGALERAGRLSAVAVRSLAVPA